MIAIFIIIGLPVAVLVFDWVRTQRIKKALAAGGEATRAVSAHHVDTRPNYDAIAHQATSTGNQSYGSAI